MKLTEDQKQLHYGTTLNQPLTCLTSRGSYLKIQRLTVAVEKVELSASSLPKKIWSTKLQQKINYPIFYLNEQQTDFIKAQAQNGLSAFQIAEILFPEGNVRRLCKEHLTVLEFLRQYEPAYVHDSETAVNRSYSPPKLIIHLRQERSTCIHCRTSKKIN